MPFAQMDQLRIEGGRPLRGEVEVSGAKNAALPILCAALLAADTVELSRVPHLHDVATTLRLLERLGAAAGRAGGGGRGGARRAAPGGGPHARGKRRRAAPGARSERAGGGARCDASRVGSVEAPSELVKPMRASILVLGPLLARFGEARVSLPGGCAIGQRPVDQHLKGLQAMGAQIAIEHG